MSDQNVTNGVATNDSAGEETLLQIAKSKQQYYNQVETRILELLADGKGHTAREIVSTCLRDNGDDVLPTNIHPHLSHIRKKIRPKGLDIICEIQQRIGYWRLARLMASSHDGKR